jgi:uncharacterized protein YfaS (alpha-2-macroglobulin family)
MKTWVFAIGALLLSAFSANAQSRAGVDLPELRPQLEQYERRVIEKAAADRRQAFELFRQVRDSMAQGRPARALEALEILAGRNNGEGEGGAQTWVRLALAWQAQSREREEPPGPAIAAAYGAYRRAQGNEAIQIEALSLLGNLLMQVARIKEANPEQKTDDSPIANFELGRRLAFQVFSKLVELAPGKYDQKKQQAEPQPFYLDHVEYPPPPRQFAYPDKDRCGSLPEAGDQESGETKIDDERIPAKRAKCFDRPLNHACLIFSRNLDAQVRLVKDNIKIELIDRSGNRSEVKLTPAAIKGKAVCYANLTFGAKYEFTLTNALRADNGAQLVGPLFAELDMPKRTPALGFRRGAHVIPHSAERKILLKTVNLNYANLMLRRIGDRNLIREIVAKHVVGGATPQDACFLLSEISEKIADGNLKMAAPHVEEKEYTLRVGDILDQRAKWLPSYVRGRPGKYNPPPNDPHALTLHFKGDEAAAAAASASQVGVFILFGKAQTESKAQDDSSDQSTTDDSAKDDKTKQCVDGIVSQWFVITNIGLTLQRTPSKIYVIARELDTGASINNVRIEFLSKSGAVLEAVTTKEDGIASIDARLGRGIGGNALAAVMAYRQQDFAFLDMTSDAIDLADRGLDGAAKLGEYSAYIMPSRGIFRPGETLEALVLVRGSDGKAITDQRTVDMELLRGDDTPLRPKQSFSSLDDGAFLFKTEIPKSVPEGALRLRASVLDKVVGSTTVEVQYYKPLTVQISAAEGSLRATINERNQLILKGKARADYLYGMPTQSSGGANSGTDAPAADLRGELQVRIEPAQSPIPGCFEGFSFGHRAEDAKATIFRGSLQPTNKNGEIEIDFPQEGIQHTDVPLQASITITLLDLNGRAAQGTFTIPVTRAGRRWIGVKPVSSTQPESVTTFEFVLLDDKNQSIQEPIKVNVFSEQTDFVWYEDGTSWEYKPVPPLRAPVPMDQPSVTRRASTGRCPAVSAFERKFPETGRYLVQVMDFKADGDTSHAATELSVGAGWSTAPDGYLKPDALRVSTRQIKDQFPPDDDVTVEIETPHKAGWVLVEVIIDGEAKHTFEAPIRQASNMTTGRATGSFKIARTWPAGAMHIYATSFRKSENDSLGAGPARAVGGLATQIGANAQRPMLTISSKDWAPSWELHNGEPLRIQITTEGLSKNAHVALAIVDKGILLLTDFQTPDPYEHFFKRRGINIDVFDNYGRILYGRYGGDVSPLPPLRGVGYQPNDIVKWHSGILQIVDNRTEIVIGSDDLRKYFPANFQGTLKLMAWAWDAKSAVKGETELIVRDPVFARLTTPQFMAPGDAALLPLRVTNTTNAVYSDSIEVTLSDGLTFARDLAGATVGRDCASPSCRRLNITSRKGEPGIAFVPVRASADKPATEEIKLSYKLDNNNLVERSLRIPVRLPAPPVVAILPQPEIAQGGERSITRMDLNRIAAQEFDVNTMRLRVRVSRNDLMSPPIPSAMAETETRQLEQLTSLLQLLLMSSETVGTPQRTMLLVERINQLISEISALQKSDGAFDDAATLGQDNRGYLADRGGASRTAATFVLDVLSRAKAAGVDVDEVVIDRSVANLLSFMLSIGPECTRADVYGLTVLARTNRISRSLFLTVGDACAKIAGNDATMKLMLAAAYGAYGFMEQAQTQLADAGVAKLPALGDSPAEAARVGALLLESGLAQVDPALILTKAGLKLPQRSESLVTSSWLARAINAALTIVDKQQRPFSQAAVPIKPDGLIARVNREGLELQQIEYDKFPTAGVQIANHADGPLKLSYVVEAVPLKARSPYSAGINIRRIRAGADSGKVTEFRQFETAYFAVEINQTDSYSGEQRLAAVQLLPAGFEGVENSYQDSWRSVIGDEINEPAIRRNALDDAKVRREREYAEFQDDRWIALPRPTNRLERHLLAFSVRPTLSGEFVLPPALIRDLNNPQRIAWTEPLRIVVLPAR